MNGGERIADALVAHGIPVIFTLCGGHISPILAAAKARGTAHRRHPARGDGRLRRRCASRG